MKKAFLFLLIAACGTTANDKLNQQSIEIHESALQVSTQFMTSLDQLAEEVKKLDSVEQSIMMDSIKLLRDDYELWESSLVEVPGHEHEHHNHDHDHDHSPDPDMTPEMMLEVQQALKVEIEELNQRVQGLLDSLK